MTMPAPRRSREVDSPRARQDPSEEPAAGLASGWGSWLWAVRLRILFVIDGRINTGTAPWGEDGFGLGPVLATLRDHSFAPWVRFEVDVAKRDGEQRENLWPDFSLPWPFGDVRPYAGLRFEGFRFTQDGFGLDDYDQVWFFGDWPGLDFDNDVRDDTPIMDPDFSPLEDEELKILAEWMDRGGGVFATGDHGMLGASLCHRIPRVRKMRKWKHEQDVPLKNALTRHETLQHDPPEHPDRRYHYPDDEGDPWGQRIKPVYRTLSSGPASWLRAPHPLLCAVDGIIDTFPDHMHEGEVVADGEVELGDPLDIPGYSRAEFPRSTDVVLPALDTAGGPEPLDFGRPRPQVIAYATTTVVGGESKQFGLVGVYDGEPVGLGRVVVDSTWHHWFSMNLIGFQQEVPHVWRRLQAYYRNVGLWLATPAQRALMLIAATWSAITGSAPMAFDRGMSPWQVGERALDVIGRTASQCMVMELVVTFLERVATDTTSVEPGLPEAEPAWSSLPVDVVNRAIVGGIGMGLLDLALGHGRARARRQRLPLDADAIRRRGLEGAFQGHSVLAATLEKAARDMGSLHERIGSGFRMPDVDAVPVEIEAIPIRIVLERVQLRAVSEGAPDEGLGLNVRVRLDGSEVATGTLRVAAVGDLHDEGPMLDVEKQIATVAVQTGDVLTLEVSAHARRRSEHIPPPTARDVLGGEPSDWIGRHVSHDRGPLRFWYRIEPADSPELGS